MATIDILVVPESNTKKMIAADREGRVIIWDINTKKMITANETDCGNVRSIHYLPQGDRFVMVCASGPVWTFSEKFEQLDFFHVGCNVMFSRLMDTQTIMVATENKELVTMNIKTHNPTSTLKVNTKEDIRCFDVTADGKYAVVVSNEIQFWKLGNQHCEANLCPVLPARCMCLTGDFVSFFMSQDTHIEKWVIDWKITYDGKKFSPPLSSFVSHNTGTEESEVSEKEYKGAIETVMEGEEEEE